MKEMLEDIIGRIWQDLINNEKHCLDNGQTQDMVSYWLTLNNALVLVAVGKSRNVRTKWNAFKRARRNDALQSAACPENRFAETA